MSAKIDPRNQMAQLHYRATGNPANSLPNAAISNCFPGLEYDFKAFWRRAFVGIVLLECDNYVIETDDAYKELLHHRLLRVEDRPVVTTATGPQIPGGGAGPLVTPGNPNGVAAMEWSNVLTFAMRRQGESVKCFFTEDVADVSVPIPDDLGAMLEVNLQVRRMLDGETAAPAKDLLNPGELTQGLCSPWQHDYRECACYYWPASRPDFVNVELGEDGLSHGDNWMSKRRTGEYALDDRHDGRFVSYDDLFKDWERMLHFEIKGRDAEES
ncbi:hypothetical protein PY650_05955 [Rhizobium calliandrae]|uniref:Uncharacterized protein n=1 Tax=Rhizobium calliandrae TaxID=1312182 RepID=A0ABT7KCT4_9HYPH|nr:hypothetical protein [Rhizobium calliandrae]MDL2405203.1 hypothetical protein [Rhizobium calliandrae]